MLTKWDIWDYFKAYPESIPELDQNLFTFFSISPFVTQIYKKRLPVDIKNNLKIVMAEDIKNDWIDQNMTSLSFFGSSDNFFIHNAQNLHKDVAQNLFEAIPQYSGKLFFIFNSSTSKDNKNFNFSKEIIGIDGHHIKINTPPFWESLKLLDFVAGEYNVLLTFGAKQLILQMVDNDIDNLVTIINIISLHFSGKVNIDDKDIAPLLVATRLDRFEAASLFSNREFKKFYTLLLSKKLEIDELRSFFSFMQTHIIKLLDPSYSQAKNKTPSKYDREIMSKSRMWKEQDLLKSLSYFSELEILAKSQSPKLALELKKNYYRSLY